ncbi:hypothetical protein AB0H36_07830 [Kribbella sp. NPDC050820]|uniref:hypothetical protein n=1 Tax=Kribbella sp. NPDC050820 TaxID=3155408 RepID=UPI0033ED4047
MKPHAAAAAAPQREAVQVGVTRAVPQETSVGVPVARPWPPKLPAAPIAQPAQAQRLTLVEQPPAPAPATDTVERPDRSIRVGQIVCWQFAVVAVGAATAGSRTALILTSAAAVSLVALTSIRIRGLWLYRWVGVLLVDLVLRAGPAAVRPAGRIRFVACRKHAGAGRSPARHRHRRRPDHRDHGDGIRRSTTCPLATTPYCGWPPHTRPPSTRPSPY